MAKLRFLFAPGAGAPSTSAWMQRYATRLRELGEVTLLDYPYMLAGQKRPDPLPRLIAAHTEALTRLRGQGPGSVVLIGKSMGGRVGCHVALSEQVERVVCLGYPLVGAGARRNVRDQVLLESTAPVLFLQGTRDPLCPLDHLQEVRRRMKAQNDLLVIDEGDHSLEVTKRGLKAQGRTQDDVDTEIIRRIARFVA